MNRNRLLSLAFLLLAAFAACSARADSTNAPRKPAVAPAPAPLLAAPSPPERAVEAPSAVMFSSTANRLGITNPNRSTLGAARPLAVPYGGRVTIAPFPVPGDTSPGAAARMKWLNTPQLGVTTIAPMPPPAGVPGGVYFAVPAPQVGPLNPAPSPRSPGKH